MTLEDVPKEVVVGVPFVAILGVANHSAHKPYQLQLQFRKDTMSGIFCSSVSHQVQDTLCVQLTRDAPPRTNSFCVFFVVFVLFFLVQNLGNLPPKTSKTVPVEFLPTVGGLQLLRGAWLVDLRSNLEFPQDVLGHVLVKSLPALAA